MTLPASVAEQLRLLADWLDVADVLIDDTFEANGAARTHRGDEVQRDLRAYAEYLKAHPGDDVALWMAAHGGSFEGHEAASGRRDQPEDRRPAEAQMTDYEYGGTVTDEPTGLWFRPDLVKDSFVQLDLAQMYDLARQILRLCPECGGRLWARGASPTRNVIYCMDSCGYERKPLNIDEDIECDAGEAAEQRQIERFYGG